LLLSIFLLLFVDSIKFIYTPVFLLFCIIWSLIEILFAIKFSLEFPILEVKRMRVFKKIINVIYWKVKT